MVESIGEVRLNGNASLASEVRVGREVEGLEIDRCVKEESKPDRAFVDP